MSLEEKVTKGIKESMLAKDQKTLRALRAIKSAILSAKTASGFSGQISETDEIKMLQKLVKQRAESLEIYEQQGREDLASKEREEIEVIQEFLPKQLSEEEVRATVTELVNELGATSMKDMGKVMGAANKKLAGKADGKTIASLVKEILSSK